MEISPLVGLYKFILIRTTEKEYFMAREVCSACGGRVTSDWNSCYVCHGAGYIDVADSSSSSSGGSSSSPASTGFDLSKYTVTTPLTTEELAQGMLKNLKRERTQADIIEAEATALYIKGDWKKLAKFDAFRFHILHEPDEHLSYTAMVMKAIARAHLGDYEKAFAYVNSFYSPRPKILTKKKLCMELFNLAKQVCEQKHKRAITEKDLKTLCVRPKNSIVVKEVQPAGFYNLASLADKYGFTALANMLRKEGQDFAKKYTNKIPSEIYFAAFQAYQAQLYDIAEILCQKR
jgi:hypothetical protein